MSFVNRAKEKIAEAEGEEALAGSSRVCQPDSNVHLYSRPPSNQLIGIVFTFLQAELVLARRICGISANSVRTISVTSTQ